MTCAEIQELLPDDISPSIIFVKAPPTAAEIVTAVCVHYNVDPGDLTLRNNNRTVSLCRILICMLAREILRMPVKDLVQIVKRHESNISNLLNKAAGRMAVDEILRDDVDIIRRRLAHAITQRDFPMPLTLEEYDHQVGHHIRMIRHHAKALAVHADIMTHQPAFEALAESELENCDAALGHALQLVAHALAVYRGKPRDD